jgi:hypothetical protein
MALNASFSVFFWNIQQLKGTWEYGREVNCVKALKPNNELYRLILNGCYSNLH